MYSAPFTVIVSGIVLFQRLLTAELSQVFQNKRAVCGDAPQCLASIHLPAVRAGIQPLLPHAVMYGAELVAKRRFCALRAAAGAVDHVRRDRYGVELRPQGGGFSRRASLFVIVAILASQVSQSSPQHAMSSFLGSRFASIFAFLSLRSIRAVFAADAGELRSSTAERA